MLEAKKGDRISYLQEKYTIEKVYKEKDIVRPVGIGKTAGYINLLKPIEATRYRLKRDDGRTFYLNAYTLSSAYIVRHA